MAKREATIIPLAECGVEMKRVLMIAYFFPPWGGSGVQRTVKLCKHLPDFQWQPIVLTVRRPNMVMRDTDSSLLQDVQHVSVHDSPIIEPSDLLRVFRRPNRRAPTTENLTRKGGKLRSIISSLLERMIIPDGRALWYFTGRKAAMQVIRQENVQAIYATSPIPTSVMLGAWLSRKTGIPFLADFRDPWRLDTMPPLLPGFGKLNALLEARTLRTARMISVVRQSQKDDLLQRFPELADRVAVIPNGYDGADFAGLSPRPFDKFTIAYSGIFYPNRGPEPVLRAVARACETVPNLRDDLLVLFLGRPDDRVERTAGDLGIGELVQCLGYQPHNESLRYICGAHLLYLNTLMDYIPGKTYEYLASGTPILGMLDPKTEVAEIIRQTESGVVIPPEAVDSTADAILRFWKQYKEGTFRRRNVDDPRITCYERREQAGRMADLLNQITQQSGQEQSS
jgi:glycosyltransferase involved in cell wall biosynthesis